ncbi:hypothetical protein C5167_049538 [Papaver somniferum]|uniref:Uncharacterized protein n=1 Tax=Papaver somniferum TaxID=3469 RepID=A0A4Y7KNV1_PAPSO|nr:uncharacterized protein LOC113301912 isoform X2 [Papaver somniferum]RZC74062.1 hypothetical protein C5167_049538 [Papaver somniferum]
MIQLLSEDTGAENFNFDGFDFLEDGELYSNTLNPGLLEDDKDDFLIDDHLNTPVVNAGDFVPSSKESPDTSHLYTSDKVFATKLDAKKWCVETGKNHNCAIVVKGGSVRKRNVWTTGKGYRFELQCERGGVYRIHKSKREISVMIGKRKRDTWSKKRGCPFLLSVL